MPALDALREAGGWTLWVTEPGKSKPIKVPMHFDGTTRHSTANPAPPLLASEAELWVEYLRASGAKHADPSNGGYVGLGFRPQPGIGCLDLDNCVDPATGGWTSAARMVYDMILPGAAVEVSVSGKGLHFWFRYTGEGYGIKHVKGHPLLGDFDLFQSDAAFVAIGTYFGGDASTDCTAGVDMLAQMAWPEDQPGERVEHSTPDDWATLTPAQREVAVADLRSALAHVSDEGNARWIQVMNALKSIGEDGKQLWFDWSRGLIPEQQGWSGDPAPDWQLEVQWARPYAGKVRRATVFKLAADGGWTNPARGARAEEVFAATGLPVPVDTPTAPREVELTFQAAAAGVIPATLANIEGALRSAEAGTRVALDEFRHVLMIGQPGAWRPLTDVDYGHLRAGFERRGFKAVPAEIMKTAVEMVAHQCRFDSAIEWANTLKWDGVLRIDNSLHRYLGCADTPYTRAVGAYLWTALAGRCLVPGIKADMALILVSPEQGKRKTSVIEAIAPYPDAFVEVSLEHRDEDMSRKMRGKLVAEIAEMRGLKGRDSEAVKAWVSRRREEWTPKYKEFATTYERRLVLIGTANEMGLLSDPTGERRWLPALTSGADEAALRRDRDQLWAEGIKRFQATGIAWQEAERLAKLEHQHFTEVDPWQELVIEWLWTPPVPAPGDAAVPKAPIEGPVKLLDVLRFGVGMPRERIDRKAELRVAGILRGLGMAPRAVREGKVGGVTRWFAK